MWNVKVMCIDGQTSLCMFFLPKGQVHEEIELCKMSVDDPLKSTRRNKNLGAATPREELPDRWVTSGWELVKLI